MRAAGLIYLPKPQHNVHIHTDPSGKTGYRHKTTTTQAAVLFNVAPLSSLFIRGTKLLALVLFFMLPSRRLSRTAGRECILAMEKTIRQRGRPSQMVASKIFAALAHAIAAISQFITDACVGCLCRSELNAIPVPDLITRWDPRSRPLHSTHVLTFFPSPISTAIHRIILLFMAEPICSQISG